jgi:hypothetical protein
VCGGSSKQRPAPSPSAGARPRSYRRASAGAARALRRVLRWLSAPYPRHSFPLPPVPPRRLSVPCCLRSASRPADSFTAGVRGSRPSCGQRHASEAVAASTAASLPLCNAASPSCFSLVVGVGRVALCRCHCPPGWHGVPLRGLLQNQRLRHYLTSQIVVRFAHSDVLCTQRLSAPPHPCCACYAPWFHSLSLSSCFSRASHAASHGRHSTPVALSCLLPALLACPTFCMMVFLDC